MTQTQITGIRMLHEETSRVVSRTMTAREMALTSHSLSRSADMATLHDGSVYVWDKRFDHWAIWKTAR